MNSWSKGLFRPCRERDSIARLFPSTTIITGGPALHHYTGLAPYTRELWEPLSFYRIPIVLYVVMVFSVLVVAGFELAFHSDIRIISVPSYLLGMIIIFSYDRVVRRTPAVWLFLGGLLIPILSWYFMRSDFADYRYADNPYPDNLLDKFIFLIPALILAGSTRNVMVVWLVATVSVFMLPWTSGDGWQEWIRALEGRRTGFGINPIRMGMIYGTVFIGTLVFYRRMVYRPDFSWPWFIAWFVLFALFGFATLATQTRSVFLAMAVLLMVALSVFGFLWLRNKDVRRLGFRSWGVIGVLLVAILVMVVRSDPFERQVTRTADQMQAVQPFLQGDFEEIPSGSVGLRLQFWVDAVSWSAERPIVGWGYRASRMMHEEAGNIFGDRYFRSLHNAYLDVQLSYGLLGTILMTAFVFWLIRGLHVAWRREVMPTDFYLFFIGFFIFFGVNSFFTSSWFISDAVYLWNIVLMGAATFIFKDYYLQNQPNDRTDVVQEKL